jgi:outer membrane lipoprotein-sorting protein
MTQHRNCWLPRILLALACGLSISVAADDSSLAPVADPRPILDDLQRKMASVRTVYFEFTQERQLKLFTDPLKSEGVMLIQRPDQIRWETTSPYQTILLANRKSVAQFEGTDGSWKKLDLAFPQLLRRVMDQMALMNQGKLDALTADYSVLVSTGHVAVLTLVPKDENARSLLSSLVVTLQADFTGTREVVLNEPGGDLTRITFRKEKRDAHFPDGTFDQSHPLDIAVVKAAVTHGL